MFAQKLHFSTHFARTQSISKNWLRFFYTFSKLTQVMNPSIHKGMFYKKRHLWSGRSEGIRCKCRRKEMKKTEKRQKWAFYWSVSMHARRVRWRSRPKPGKNIWKGKKFSGRRGVRGAWWVHLTVVRKVARVNLFCTEKCFFFLSSPYLHFFLTPFFFPPYMGQPRLYWALSTKSLEWFLCSSIPTIRENVSFL